MTIFPFIPASLLVSSSTLAFLKKANLFSVLKYTQLFQLPSPFLRLTIHIIWCTNLIFGVLPGSAEAQLEFPSQTNSWVSVQHGVLQDLGSICNAFWGRRRKISFRCSCKQPLWKQKQLKLLSRWNFHRMLHIHIPLVCIYAQLIYCLWK